MQLLCSVSHKVICSHVSFTQARLVQAQRIWSKAQEFFGKAKQGNVDGRGRKSAGAVQAGKPAPAPAERCARPARRHLISSMQWLCPPLDHLLASVSGCLQSCNLVISSAACRSDIIDGDIWQHSSAVHTYLDCRVRHPDTCVQACCGIGGTNSSCGEACSSAAYTGQGPWRKAEGVSLGDITTATLSPFCQSAAHL